MKRCMMCGDAQHENILVTLVDAAETRVMCPNCIARAVISENLSFEPDSNLVCDITGELGAVRFINEFENYTLSPKAMLRLLAHSLYPHEWKALAEKYGSDKFMLHGDFYDDEGNAWQPYTDAYN